MTNNRSKILIIEDDKFLRDLILRKLEDEGFIVSFAITGEDALEMLKQETPALILLDIILPGINGFEVLKRLKSSEREEIRAIPVVILSNLGQAEDIEQGKKLGAVDFLIKVHLTPSEIIKRIESFLK